jgi:putative cardiolipin synthase
MPNSIHPNRTPILILAAALLLTGCARLPTRADIGVSRVLEDTDDTTLGRALLPLAAAHPGDGGIVPLRDPGDAFAARLQLARAAERSIDLQYYIWHDDASGRRLFDTLRAAADRGVRVRLLLDDSNTAGMDTVLAALDAHENIEVRLFNPFLHRRFRTLDYITSFRRVIRRMHNKSFTVDNQATIVGGRNIGDEYFGAPDAVQFEDLDVIAVGPPVKAVSESFDRYWASASSWPLASLLKHATTAIAPEPAATQAWLAEADSSPLLHDLLQDALPIEWAPARILSDDPAKGLGRAKPQGLLTQSLFQLFGNPQHEVELISPYFVPASEGTRFLTGLAQRGVKIRILTNSLEATDVPPAHAGYARRRTPLLRAGITLFELRRTTPRPATRATPRTGIRRPGSSRSSLHAKTFAIDQRRIYVGSFNFDPRSALLNTEMGIAIDSRELAQTMSELFDDDIPQRAYEVQLTPARKTVWIERNDTEVTRHDSEPGTTWWQRFRLRVLEVLPLEWLM